MKTGWVSNFSLIECIIIIQFFLLLLFNYVDSYDSYVEFVYDMFLS